METYKKVSYSGIAFGFLLAIFSGIRYSISYPDMDRAGMYVLIGLSIMGISYVYNKVKNLKEIDIKELKDELFELKGWVEHFRRKE